MAKGNEKKNDPRHCTYVAKHYTSTKDNVGVAPHSGANAAQLACGFQIPRLNVSELGSQRARFYVGLSESEALHECSAICQKRRKPHSPAQVPYEVVTVRTFTYIHDYCSSFLGG